MTPIIELSHVTYSYPNSETPALNDLSLTINQGEWIAIIGHNGSGKSTLAKLLNYLLAPTAGEITIAGTPVNEDNMWTIRDLVGMVFQNPDNQFVGATVEDDVAFGLENQGVPLEEMRVRVQEALELVGMASFKKREPARLSGGQKQRVAIAGIVALRPNIVILDEATSMLDPEGRLELIRIVKEIKDEHNMTVISITHDLDEVALSDRVIVMKNGQIESTSTPAELFMRDDLIELDLEQPFTANLAESLRQAGIAIPLRYFTEEELEETLWEFISKK